MDVILYMYGYYTYIFHLSWAIIESVYASQWLFYGVILVSVCYLRASCNKWTYKTAPEHPWVSAGLVIRQCGWASIQHSEAPHVTQYSGKGYHKS